MSQTPKEKHSDPARVGYIALDTYHALLCNESPPRKELVTEIQDRDSGVLLCYAAPEKAEEIIMAVKRQSITSQTLEEKYRDLCQLAGRMAGQLEQLSCLDSEDADELNRLLDAEADEKKKD